MGDALCKYSIILPVRNGGEYLKECVNSILAQTFVHFNLIVLDNCSTDGTVQWLEQIADDRILIYSSTTSLSIEENWARITTVEKNEFITLIGHDDLLAPDYLQSMEALIARFPQATLYQTHFNFINSRGGVIRSSQPMPSTLTAPDFCQSVLSGKFDITGTGFMCRSADYDAVGGIPLFEKLLFADYALWLLIAARSFVAVHAGNCSSFRVHQNTSQTTNHAIYIKALGTFVEYLKQQAHQEVYATVIPAMAPQFIRNYAASLADKLLRVPTKDRQGFSVKGIYATANQWCKELSGKASAQTYLPANAANRLALLIDTNAPGRWFFRKLRKWVTAKSV